MSTLTRIQLIKTIKIIILECNYKLVDIIQTILCHMRL